jgi:hypothetical protein
MQVFGNAGVVFIPDADFYIFPDNQSFIKALFFGLFPSEEFLYLC